MSAPVDVLAVLDVRRELGVKQSTKNPNAGFVDWRDWCAFLGRADEARAAVAELIEALRAAKNTLVAFKFLPGEANRWEEHDEDNLALVDAALAQQPAAPVGVEWLVRDWRSGCISAQEAMISIASLAQQPAAPSGEAVAQLYISDRMEELCPMPRTQPGALRRLLGNGTHNLYTAPQQPAAVDEDYQYGLTFILSRRDAITAMCSGPSERFVVERTFAALAAQQQEVCRG